MQYIHCELLFVCFPLMYTHGDIFQKQCAHHCFWKLSNARKKMVYAVLDVTYQLFDQLKNLVHSTLLRFSDFKTLKVHISIGFYIDYAPTEDVIL